MPDVWQLYEAHARAFDRDRGRSLMERAYLEGIVAALKPNARVLDISKERFPHAKWVVADMDGLVLPLRFDALLAWDSLFHLNRNEQRAMFPVFAKHVTPGGVLLFTSGSRDGEVTGDLYGNELYHASLAPDKYRALLGASGFKVLHYREDDPDCGGHTVWFAQALK